MGTLENNKNIEQKLQDFEIACQMHLLYTEASDYKNANKQYSKIMLVIGFLKKENLLFSLKPFLNNNNKGVKLWASTYWLLVNEIQAIEVLIELTKDNDIVAFLSETTIQEWKKGTMKL